MKTGRILRKIAMLLSLVMLVTSTIGTTYCYIVTKTDPISNIFVPEGAGASTLTVSKTVEHPLGEDYAIGEHISFDFRIELGAYYAGAKLNTTAGEMTADENGALCVSVRPGVDFGIGGLEEGTVVTVTELATERNGFAVKGDATQTVTVGADGTAAVRFVNAYTPGAVSMSNITVGGIKVLEGRPWQSGDSFTFVLEQKTGESWTKLGEQTVSYDEDDADFSKFDFNEIFRALTFDRVGTYTFRMSEVIGSLENVDYDRTVNHFTVKVTDVDMDGRLEVNAVSGTENAAVTETEDGCGVFVTFNNTFVAPVLPDPDPITVTVGISKIVNNIGQATHGLGGFRFVLENTESAEAIGAISNDDGKASFGLVFTKEDIGNTYSYKLFLDDQGLDGMHYDQDVYEITVTVILNENNELVAALTMDGQPVDSLNAIFESTYDADVPDTPTVPQNRDFIWWFIVMIVSGSILIALIVYDRKSDED